VSKFKVYGEALDPELSNLKILTSGFGFRPSANVSVDIVVHRYRLDEISDEVRNSALTALANQAGESKDVGKGLDIVVGVRRAFGIRRLGMDFRVGWFSPGRAYLRDEGTEDAPDLRRPQKAVAFITKIWW
jgi:alginate production protein